MDAVERPPHLSPPNSTLNKSVSAFTLEIFCSMDAASRGPMDGFTPYFWGERTNARTNQGLIFKFLSLYTEYSYLSECSTELIQWAETAKAGSVEPDQANTCEGNKKVQSGKS